MHSPYARVLRTLCLLFIATGCVHLGTAEEPSRFAGSYRLTNIVEDGSQVKLTVTITLLNPANADIKGGIVTLMDSQPHATLIGSVGTIKLLPHLGQATVSKAFTIPASEYVRWQSSGQPAFEFLMPTAAGTMELPIQARPIAAPIAAKN